ncbi:hypothetical protein GUJ93_ZPchr0111g33296 [Zizania palustris]|uniref:BOS complex subunit TMEM147 n=1 Tax=Zizania palustris TaxID=103762 RepID=A0A8J5RC57_ZIZPA|nr:hypothetical protein GUJ93_ZPchr0111g33296 [Zizania palustris]
MAAYATKIFALFALFVLSASAATAVTTMQYFPPMMAMGTMDPCRQYMMQTLGMGSFTAMFMSQPMSFLRQQCCMQMQLQAMMPQCHCDASCQMMQNRQVICGGLEHQQMMKMAMDMPYVQHGTTADEEEDGNGHAIHLFSAGQSMTPLARVEKQLCLSWNSTGKDVAGLYFALTQLTHRNISQNHKFQAVGLGWAFADSVLHRLAPLWIGARGLEFTWEYIFKDWKQMPSCYGPCPLLH